MDSSSFDSFGCTRPCPSLETTRGSGSQVRYIYINTILYNQVDLICYRTSFYPLGVLIQVAILLVTVLSIVFSAAGFIFVIENNTGTRC